MDTIPCNQHCDPPSGFLETNGIIRSDTVRERKYEMPLGSMENGLYFEREREKKRVYFLPQLEAEQGS